MSVDQLVYQSAYLDVPPHWIIEALVSYFSELKNVRFNVRLEKSKLLETLIY